MKVNSVPALPFSCEGKGAAPQGESTEVAPSNLWPHHEQVRVPGYGLEEKAGRNRSGISRWGQEPARQRETCHQPRTGAEEECGKCWRGQLRTDSAIQVGGLGPHRDWSSEAGSQNKERELGSRGGGGKIENSSLLEHLLHFPTLPTQTGSATGHS